MKNLASHNFFKCYTKWEKICCLSSTWRWYIKATFKSFQNNNFYHSQTKKLTWLALWPVFATISSKVRDNSEISWNQYNKEHQCTCLCFHSPIYSKWLQRRGEPTCIKGWSADLPIFFFLNCYAFVYKPNSVNYYNILIFWHPLIFSDMEGRSPINCNERKPVFFICFRFETKLDQILT